MRKPEILVIVAHPDLDQSRANRIMSESIHQLPNVRLHDLYKEYSDFKIDVRREQLLLKDADLIVLQFPFYWYSAPALLKEWMDRVLEQGFAFGKGGDQLVNKDLFLAISVGGAQEAYQPGGESQFAMTDFLRPFQQTAKFCNLNYRSPFVVHHIFRKSDEELKLHADAYRDRLAQYTHLCRP